MTLNGVRPLFYAISPKSVEFQESRTSYVEVLEVRPHALCATNMQSKKFSPKMTRPHLLGRTMH